MQVRCVGGWKVVGGRGREGGRERIKGAARGWWGEGWEEGVGGGGRMQMGPATEPRHQRVCSAPLIASVLLYVHRNHEAY